MLDIRELLNLKEAYAEVYASQELTEDQVWEEVETWVNSLIEEGYDLSDYTWEEMYEAYLSELNMDKYSGPLEKPKQIVRRPMASMGPNYADQETKLSQAANRSQIGTSRQGSAGGNSGLSNIPPPKPAKDVVVKAAQKPPAKGPVLSKLNGVEGTGVGKDFKPRAFTDAEKSRYSSVATQNAARSSTPAAPAAPKPAAAPAAKPAGSAMDQFAKANPKLAAASAERARTRGTSATTNPLMKDMKSRLPAPKTPSPTTAKTGFDLAKKGVNLAAGFDMFDVVKGYLIGEGYADTEEAALAIMTNMSEEWKQSIIKSI